MKKYKKILFALIPIFIFFLVNIVKAQIQLQVGLPSAKDGTISSVSGLSEYIRIVYNYGIYAGSVIAVVMISINAFKWVSAGGNKSIIGKAKDGMITSIVGLFLLFGSYLILSTINGDLVALKALDVKTLDTLAWIEQAERSSGLNTDYYDPNLYTADPGHESEGPRPPVAVLRCNDGSAGDDHYCVPFSNRLDVQYEYNSIIIGACPREMYQCVSNFSRCTKICTNINDCGVPSNGYCDGPGQQVCCKRNKIPNGEICTNSSMLCESGCCCTKGRNTCRTQQSCQQMGGSCR